MYYFRRHCTKISFRGQLLSISDFGTDFSGEEQNFQHKIFSRTKIFTENFVSPNQIVRSKIPATYSYVIYWMGLSHLIPTYTTYST